MSSARVRSETAIEPPSARTVDTDEPYLSGRRSPWMKEKYVHAIFESSTS